MLAAASPGRMDFLGHLGTLATRPGPLPRAYDWARMGVNWYLTCSTDDISTHPQLCIGCSEGRSTVHRPEHLKEGKARFDFSSPRSVLSPPLRLPDVPPTICCCCWAWRQGVLLRRCLARGRKYDLAVRPQYQCSANPMLTSDAKTCFCICIQGGAGSGLQHSTSSSPIAELLFPSPAKFPHLPQLPLNAEHTQGQATFFKHQLCESAPQGTAQSQ